MRQYFSSLSVSASAPNMQAELNGWNFEMTILVQRFYPMFEGEKVVKLKVQTNKV